ncbi:hypothetical protein POVCU2_0092590 [Plasmodium ovale curtisi]|uniref:PIR Superfamily Protein n=1 Tax=Plasmodium ovale curtisi TaxID=864141 RepID=A0A1A8WQ69_PLAOA|nr:hypothetical protein POVCU2_0092590 [Plasmodium ovale curtisi]SBT00026.1 hypothetical protein POVCU1_056910 [Plasmodium ovale curtisi]
MKFCQKKDMIKNRADGNKYFRDISYYLDLVNGIIKSITKFSDTLKDNLTKDVESMWIQIPQVKHLDKSTRETDLA